MQQLNKHKCLKNNCVDFSLWLHFIWIQLVCHLILSVGHLQFESGVVRIRVDRWLKSSVFYHNGSRHRIFAASCRHRGLVTCARLARPSGRKHSGYESHFCDQISKSIWEAWITSSCNRGFLLHPPRCKWPLDSIISAKLIINITFMLKLKYIKPLFTIKQFDMSCKHLPSLDKTNTVQIILGKTVTQTYHI